ncbi:hypothetical protein J31TS4_36600 [Paenibacillus sp. J31TS4]|uniref:hypothetical protein n=1 Tax=Paenibacillus sp. J31TS4 TaxID=2807195 RepID=UPI001B252947|nr:hypothetical protein [Paenibacillus sp. J31TS4]GIP40380.1 hypothetical protein J31TS4_36600 [Paenibacillus sp. J31TS4]
MSSDMRRLLGVVQMVVEACIALGYLVGLIPFAFLWSSSWVVPLVLVSFVLALLLRNNTLVPAVVNVLMAFLSFIPLLGYVTRIIGILLSLYNLSQIRRTS